MGILVNGNGNPHVYAHQDSDLIAGIVGNQTSIMPVGDKFEANQEDANTIALSSGVIITKEGRRIQLDAGTIDEFIIPTGAQDVQSFYIIGYHLYEDGNSDQLCETFVRKMDSASDTIPESTFRSGATEVYVSLYRVKQDSLNITDIDLLLPYADSIAEVKRNGGNKNLAAIEDGSTASQPYVKGEFVIVGGQFCEVTASISTNDAFIAYPLPNYNIKAGTVGEQITALNQNLTKCLTYNEDTDYFGMMYEGTWHDVIPAHFQHLVYFNPTLGYNLNAFGEIVSSCNISSWPQCSCTINTDYINYHTGGASGGSGIFTTTNYVDITNYRTLVLKGIGKLNQSTGSSSFAVELVDRLGTAKVVGNTEALTTTSKVLDKSLDLSAYSGEYKIRININVSVASGTVTADVNVTELYLD